ncbi:hypothetical protein J437_LFUL017124 [Ladona fulva]|uniref:Tc1-like transposase DDE domain-containing protein n=1 Tax=Ladona fulva TaxID=123851 RepID=A0A8K0P5N2_LADFU|nr:hypothetical protein J437_LFUL017124 [Ladona fulva]
MTGDDLRFLKPSESLKRQHIHTYHHHQTVTFTYNEHENEEFDLLSTFAMAHHAELNRPPSSNAKKDTMKEWLDLSGQQYSSKETKIELYEKIRRHKEARIFEVYRVFAEHRHSVLRLPPYHPELNPIENIWGIMKNWVAMRNVTFKLEDVKKLVIEKCTNIGKEEWEGVCEKVKGIEKLASTIDEVLPHTRRLTHTSLQEEWLLSSHFHSMENIS